MNERPNPDNESAISFGEAKVGSMEAYNFSAGASITTVHAENEGKGESVASAKTMAKSVFSIATNITSGSEDGGSGSEEEMDEDTTVSTPPKQSKTEMCVRHSPDRISGPRPRLAFSETKVSKTTLAYKIVLNENKM